MGLGDHYVAPVKLIGRNTNKDLVLPAFKPSGNAGDVILRQPMLNAQGGNNTVNNSP